MSQSSCSRKFLFLLLFVQLGFGWTWAAHAGKPNKPSMMSGPEIEKMVMDKLKMASPELLAKGQRQAARKLQGNFAKSLSTMTSKRAASMGGSTLEIPLEVREYMKIIMAAIKSGKLSGPILASLGEILMQSKGNPAQQIQTTINEVLPRAPDNLKNPLQGLMTFVKENQTGINTLLDKLISGTPSLLNGVVQSLASTVGATNAAIGGSTESLNQMVGGLLSGLPVGGLLPGR